MTNGTASGTNGIASEPTLLPCPFCGCEYIDEYEGDYGNGVYCMNCGAMIGEPIHMEFRTDDRVTYEQAAEAWNARVAVTDHDFAIAVHDGELWGKCSECKERQGYYLDAETIRNQQERIAELEGELSKSYDAQGVKAEELTRRGVLLDKQEDLMLDLYAQLLNAYDAKELDGFAERMRELGIEVKYEG